VLTSSKAKNMKRPMLVASSYEEESVRIVAMVVWAVWGCSEGMWGRECGEKKEMNQLFGSDMWESRI